NLVVMRRVTATTGAGIRLAAIEGSAAVTVSRNVINNSVTGIVVGDVGSSQTLQIHNNFILDSVLDGIAFVGAVTGGVDVLQNVLADSGRDGVRVDSTASIGNGRVRIRLNFMPTLKLDTHGNGGFGFNSEGTGTADIEYNWWGSTAATSIASAIKGAGLPALVLTSGIDNNIVPAAALADTGLDPFAFQQDSFAAPVFASFDQGLLLPG